LDRLADEIRRELERFGPSARIQALADAWPGAVGAENARRSWPARVSRDGTLHVHAADSVWAFELTQLEPEIRRRLGALAPPRIRFAPGPLPEADDDAFSAPHTGVVRPSNDDRRTGDALAAPIADEKLRKLVAHTAAASLARARSSRSV
jgi:hypothetical protein